MIVMAPFFCVNKDAHAAILINVSDAMSVVTINDDSDHVIKMQTPSGVHAPAATITIAFDNNFIVSGVSYADIDLSHGPATGYETEESLAAAAGVNVWGAAFSGNMLTLVPPTNAGANEIGAGDIIVIEIGTIAAGGINMINNPAAEGTYPIAIAGGFGDYKTISVLVKNTIVGITAVVSSPPGGGDATPPIISNVQVINITPYSATVTWQTNENANSFVDYGLTLAYEIGTVFDSSYVTAHSLDLTGLIPDTLYHFQVISRDISGNMAVAGDFTFTTLPLISELIIFNVRAENITAHSADIVWETNLAADSRADFGLTEGYEIGYSENGNLVFVHTIPLFGLLADTTYYFSVTSKDGDGHEVTSIGHSFTTLAEEFFVPNVNNFQAEADIDNARVILTWVNPDFPEFAGVLIKRSTIGYPATPLEGNFVYDGIAQLAYDTNVEFGIIYYYSAFAYDINGNFSSGAFAWTVLIPEYSVHIKAWPEKRVPREGNWETNGVLAFLTPGTPVITNLYSVTTDNLGEADVLVDDLLPGAYDTTFKGLSHLKKKVTDIDIDPVSHTFIDFTFGESFSVLAGDVHVSKDNYVNGLDISAMVPYLYSGNVDADLNLDSQVNGLDLSILVYNLYKWGD